MATLTRQRARKEYQCSKCAVVPISPGEEYYRFKLTRFSQVDYRCMAHKPTRQEQTTSDFMSQLYDIEDAIAAFDATAIDRDFTIEEITGDLEQLRDEQEEKRYNMPDSLQEAPTGEMLQERYDAVQEMIDELEAIDLTFDDDLDDDEFEERGEAILEEIQAVSYCGP